MTRRCSHCGNNGHNSRTCPNRGVKIFGVRFDGGGSIRKTQSMGNLSQCAGGSGGGSPAMDDGGEEREKDGYASEDYAKGSGSSCRERKKGVAWTEEEHRMFLLGLQKLGKGDWRGISRKFVISRTATQVASHAQKYFLRQINANRRKRRTSLFDMVPDEVGEAQPFPLGSQEADTYRNDDNRHPASDSSNPAPAPLSLENEHEPLKLNSSNLVAAPPPPLPPPLPALPPFNVQPYTINMEGAALKPGAVPYPYPMMFSPYPPFFPFSYPFWPYGADAMVNTAPSVVKPTPHHSTVPINVDQLASMSKLSIGDADVEGNSSAVPLNLLGGSERHSAFHTSNPPSSSSRMNSNSSPIHAI